MTQETNKQDASAVLDGANKFSAERERKDPCVKENELSMKCLDDNGYDRSKCELHFENYRNCRKFWAWIKNYRKRQGIEPHLPPPMEREEVKKKFLNEMYGNR